MFQIGLENNTEGRSQAWALGHPGCFAYGVDGSAALNAVPQAIKGYCQWVGSHTSESWLPETDVEFRLEETWECYSINSDYEIVENGYEVNAWFRHDWIPLSNEDIQHGLQLLEWGRVELLEMVSHLSQEILDRTYPQERWSIAGVLMHIGSAEWWYQDLLGVAFRRDELPDDPFDRLDKVRSNLIGVLPKLAGSKKVVGIQGEFWSPRKMLRRAVWHEYDHIAHIRKLI